MRAFQWLRYSDYGYQRRFAVVFYFGVPDHPSQSLTSHLAHSFSIAHSIHMATKMGMGHTVKCAFRLTSLLKKAERSFHQKGKAVDHSHPAVPSLTLPDIDCSDHGLRPLCKEMGMDAYNKDTFSDSDSDSDTNTDTDTDTSSVFIPDLAVRAKPADADADADAVAGSSSNHPHNGNRKRLVRIVSFKSIAHNRSRWSSSQERELAIAQHELARCQKAWSSEQELWLEYVGYQLTSDTVVNSHLPFFFLFVYFLANKLKAWCR